MLPRESQSPQQGLSVCVLQGLGTVPQSAPGPLQSGGRAAEGGAGGNSVSIEGARPLLLLFCLDDTV